MTFVLLFGKIITLIWRKNKLKEFNIRVEVYANIEDGDAPRVNDPTVNIYAEGTNASRFTVSATISAFDEANTAYSDGSTVSFTSCAVRVDDYSNLIF